MKKFQNKYRIPSARAAWWDYGTDAAYFVTLCTAHRIHFFGEIMMQPHNINVETQNIASDRDQNGGGMVETQNIASDRDQNGGGMVETQNVASLRATEIGKIAETCWREIPVHFPFVRLGAFVVMPNHVHGIIIIEKTTMGNAGDVAVETQNFASDHHPNDATMPVETQDVASLRGKNKFGPQSQNLASIIRGYKIGVTKQSKTICPGFEWQPRFHDHIIRDENEYRRIDHYIRNNPSRWKEDKFFRSE